MEQKAAFLQANVCKRYGITREELMKGVDQYSSLATGKFCGDTQVLLAIIHLLTAGDIGGEEKTEPIGKAQTGFCLREHVGDGKTDDGKKFEIAVAMNYAPLVVYGKRFFVIDWQDVIKLAEQAGLFADEQ